MPSEPYPLTQCKTVTLEEFAKLDISKYAMEAKVDGWRIQIEASDDGCTAWTRTQHIATGKMPKVEHALQRVAGSIGSFRLDGEVVYLDSAGNPDFNFTSRCMGSGIDVCVDKQMVEDRYLSFVVFDILRFNHHDMRSTAYGDRRKVLVNLLQDVNPYLQVIEAEPPTLDTHGQNIEQFEEGSVLKLLSAPYVGKRHKSWLKMKDVETIDVTIIGYKEGQGKYKDLIGAITFKAYDGTVGNCSGMDDETRVYITNNKATLQHTTIEVKHYGKLVDGFRHPQFVRFRPDK